MRLTTANIIAYVILAGACFGTAAQFVLYWTFHYRHPGEPHDRLVEVMLEGARWAMSWLH
jgi:hypothetical protein